MDVKCFEMSSHSQVLRQYGLNGNHQPTRPELDLSRTNCENSAANGTNAGAPAASPEAACADASPVAAAAAALPGDQPSADGEGDGAWGADESVYTAPAIRIPRPKGGRYRPLTYGRCGRRPGGAKGGKGLWRRSCSLSLMDALVEEEDPGADEGAEL